MNNNNSTKPQSPSELKTPHVVSGRDRAQPRRILVVDDEFDARVLANRVLSEAGFEVTTVQSGFECLEQFWKRPHWFDLIVLDLSMPFMDGEETFRRLRAIKPNAIVLLSTGFFAQAQGRVDRMLAAGLSGYIRKPHRPDELVAQVQATLERARMSRGGCLATN